MNTFFSPSAIPANPIFKKGDLFVLVGELFGRGYANGLVNKAKKEQMTIIGLTVGRREKGQLRPLNAEELENAQNLLGGKIINIPLESGFDLEEVERADNTTVTPADLLTKAKIDDWEKLQIDWTVIEKAKEKGKQRFKKNLQLAMAEIEKIHQPGQNIFFAHVMAGGIPRSKIMMVIANRVFKGRGERYIHSGRLWNSPIGQLTASSFDAVTADTFQYLIEAAQPLLERSKKENYSVRFSAYGYHGTEVLINNQYSWQTYTPYQQGHAKKRLENFAKQAREKGIAATVFNCPEIRTNSSDIFLGVELSLFPLLLALEKECHGQWVKEIFDNCRQKLKEEVDLRSLLNDLNTYFLSPVMKQFICFEDWPKENSPELADLMVGTSERVTQAHLDRKDLIADYLSSLIIEATGEMIFNSIGSAEQQPVVWLGHRLVAKQLQQIQDDQSST